MIIESGYEMDDLVKRAAKGEKESPEKLLLSAGLLSLQSRAAQSFKTDELPPISIEQYWQESPYSRKPYPIRFVGRVTTDWMNHCLGSYSLAPQGRIGLESRIYKLLEK